MLIASHPALALPARLRRRRERAPWLLAQGLVPALMLALLGACAGTAPEAAVADRYKRLDPPAFAQQSLVYGYLNMEAAPTDLGWMEFSQAAPAAERLLYQMRIHEGVFYMEKFPPGVFELGEFGGRRWSGQQLAYRLPRTSPKVRVAIETPGLHFVGSYTYRDVEGPRAGHRRFALNRSDAPSEAVVLARILPFATGTPWEARIRQRMATVR